MLVQFVKSISNFGVADNSDIEELSSIRFINIFILISCPIIVFFILYLINYLPDAKSLLITGVFQLIFYIVALLFNYYKRYFLARNIFSFTALIATSLESVVTNFYCDIHFFLLIGVIFAFFVFPERERKYSYFISLCFAVTYILIEINLGWGNLPSTTPHFIMNLKHIFRSTFLILVFFFAYYSYKTIKGVQGKLIVEHLRIENEITFARNIQQQIIPLKDPAENICSFYKSMSQVGGDFYEFIFFRDPKKLGIFISDVSGHGVPAALITTMIKTAIFQSGILKENPSDLLMYLNDILIQQSGGNFITAFYGVYNSDDRRMVYSNAGHNFPFIIDSLDVREIQGGRSIPLAVLNNVSLFDSKKAYINSEITFSKNDKILLYTDGMTETRSMKNNSLLFEDSGMHELFKKYQSIPSKKFIESIYNDLVSFNGSDNFEDDICMICIDIL